MHAVLEAETMQFLEGGCGLIVGTVGPDGAPHACRGWGLALLAVDATDDEPLRFRLLLDAADPVALAHVEAGCAIAITAADVPTLRSVQLKGRAADVEPATDADRRTADAYTDAFFGDIVTTDGTPRPVLDRIRPATLAACAVVVDEVFDQTPGPGAGAPLPRAT